MTVLEVGLIKNADYSNKDLPNELASLGVDLLQFDLEVAARMSDNSLVGSSGAAIGAVSDLSALGSSVKGLYDQCNKLSNYQNQIESLLSKLEKLDDPVQVQVLSKTVAKLDEEKNNLEGELQATLTNLVAQGVSVGSDGGDVFELLIDLGLVDSTLKTVDMAGKVFAGISFAAAILGVVASVRDVLNSNDELKRQREEIASLAEKLNDQDLDPYVAHVLQAKFDHEMKVVAELEYDLVKGVISASAGTLGAIGSAKAVLIAVGCVLSSTALTALTATGYGAMGLAAVGLAAASGKVIYDHRHDIAYHSRSIVAHAKRNHQIRNLFGKLSSWKKADERLLSLKERREELKILVEASLEVVKRLGDGQDGESDKKQMNEADAQLEKHRYQLEQITREISSLEKAIERYEREVGSTDQILLTLYDSISMDRDQYRWKKLEEQFGSFDKETIQVIANVAKEGLQKGSSKVNLLEILNERSGDMLTEQTVTVEDVFKYILS